MPRWLLDTHSLKDSQVLEEKDFYCAGYKMYFEHVLRRVHTDLVRATRAAGSGVEGRRDR